MKHNKSLSSLSQDLEKQRQTAALPDPFIFLSDQTCLRRPEEGQGQAARALVPAGKKNEVRVRWNEELKAIATLHHAGIED